MLNLDDEKQWKNSYIRQLVLKNEIRRNPKNKKFYSIYDEPIKLAEIAEDFNVSYGSLRYHLKEGSTLKDAIGILVKKMQIAKLAREYKIPFHTLYMRIYRQKMSLEDALKTPIRKYERGGKCKKQK